MFMELRVVYVKILYKKRRTGGPETNMNHFIFQIYVAQLMCFPLAFCHMHLGCKVLIYIYIYIYISNV